MAAGPPSQDWTKTFNTLKEFHDLSYVKLDEGIKLENEGKKEEALSRYEEGLRLMDLALELTVECPQNADINWERACVMLQKLRKTRKEVLARIAEVQVSPPPVDQSLLPPPSYEEAMSATPSLSPMSPLPPSNPPFSNAAPAPSTSFLLPADRPRNVPYGGSMTYSELGEALNNLKVQTNTQSAQVIYTYENVRIYFIHPDGTVSAPSEPGTLRVLQLEDGANDVAKFYLQVGEWFYPLVPDVSPCLRTSYGAYILPDVNSDEQGAAVGLILPPETDESMSEFLDDLLHNVVTVEVEDDDTKPPRPLSPTLTEDTSSAKISRTLIADNHKHHKKRLVRGLRHRRHHRGERSRSDAGEAESVSSDQSSGENSRKPKHDHRRGHRRHHRRHHHGHGKSEGIEDKNSYDPPPPYDEMGKEAENFEDKDEIEEVAGVEVDDREKSKKHSRGKHSRRHKRYTTYSHDGVKYTTKFERGANYLSGTIIKGAERASQYLNSKTPVLKEKLVPEKTPRQVSPAVARNLKTARDVTGTAVTVTGFVAGKIGGATMALGRYLAPHVQTQGTRLLTAVSGMDEKKASDRVGGALQIAAGAVEGLSTVYEGLEKSAGILGKSLGDNTVQLVKHKYGDQMGEATDNTITTVGNVISVHQNAKILTPKNVAKRTVKDAGKAMVYDYSRKPTQPQNQQESQNKRGGDFNIDKNDGSSEKSNTNEEQSIKKDPPSEGK